MKCPLCSSATLTPTILETHLSAYQCTRCEGHWIAAADYWSWLEVHGETLPEKSSDTPLPEVVDNQKAIFCPECNRLMLKCKVGHALNFRLDQCSACNGIWFDRNEWASLREKNLHDEVHKVFTSPWQAQVREEERRQAIEKVYQQTLGHEDYTEAQRIKDWINTHREKQTLLSFLNFD
jgi:Zn-finger nucleic acid-binding protein